MIWASVNRDESVPSLIWKPIVHLMCNCELNSVILVHLSVKRFSPLRNESFVQKHFPRYSLHHNLLEYNVVTHTDGLQK